MFSASFTKGSEVIGLSCVCKIPDKMTMFAVRSQLSAVLSFCTNGHSQSRPRACLICAGSTFSNYQYPPCPYRLVLPLRFKSLHLGLGCPNS